MLAWQGTLIGGRIVESASFQTRQLKSLSRGNEIVLLARKWRDKAPWH